MRNLTHALTFIAAFLCVPIGELAAEFTVAAAGPASGTVDQIAYSSHARSRHAVNLQRADSGRHLLRAPGLDAPFNGLYGHRSPQPQHQRYFSLHGYWSPTWRYPRSLYYHHHARGKGHGSLGR